MKEEYKKYGIGILIVSLTLLSLLYMIRTKNTQYEFISSSTREEAEELAEELAPETEAEPLAEVPAQVPVYVCGAVMKPEVYYLGQNAIVKEAIMAAGGFAPDADTEIWNLAMEVQSGLKIYVPKLGEEIDKSGISYDNRMEGNIPSDTGAGLINVNRANIQELSTLPGIGPSISQNIIDYRDANGDFKSLDELGNVARIGKVTLEKIKDAICFQ